MTNSVIPFSFNSNEVRTIVKDDAVWFVASDIAKALDYAVAKDLVRMLDEDERGGHIVPTPSGDQEMTIINESGLYHALIKSRKPEAKPFRKWVTGEVLPTIRKTGTYSAPERKTKQVLIGGQTEDQCDAIKALVKARAEALPQDKRAKATITMWSAVKTKFGMTYKAVAPEEFTNILSLIARVPLEGEFIAATDEPKAIETPKETNAPKAIEAPTTVPSIAPDFKIERDSNWHVNFQQGQESVNAIRLSVCTGDAKRLDQVKYALRNAQSKIYNIDFCADGISTGYIDMVSRYAIVGMQACQAPLVANRI
jgi:prophage antirepressor-like protein